MHTQNGFSERSAIIQYDGRLPKSWAEGLAKLCTMDTPRDITVPQWESIVKVAALFADSWAMKAMSLGWTVEEIFGIHKICPSRRFGSMGLVYCLATTPADKMLKIDARQATIVTLLGTENTFSREDFNMNDSALRRLWDEAGPVWKPFGRK